MDGRRPSALCLQANPEDSLLLPASETPGEVAFSLGRDVMDPTGYSSTQDSPTLVSSNESPLESYLTEVNSSRDMPELELPPVAEFEVSSPSKGNLSDYLEEFLKSDIKRKAKERRMKRMAILKMKRKTGLISFTGPRIRYENKRRV